MEAVMAFGVIGIALIIVAIVVLLLTFTGKRDE